jgi:putative copper export protein
MSPDGVSVLLRALAFFALCQTLGGALFFAWQRERLLAASIPLRSLGTGAALCAALLLLAQVSIEAGRMAGEWSGVRDATLQYLAFSSAAGTVLATRCLALLAAVVALRLPRRAARPLACAALLLGAASFALTGHTTNATARATAASLLTLHVAIVLGWVGALWPLRLVVQKEPAAVAAAVVAAFSRVATWCVPPLPLLGIALATLLLPSWAGLASPYGELLLVKFGGLSLALLLAAINRSVHGPQLATGGAPAARRFAIAVLIEALLLGAVLLATAAMTGLYSPDGG